MQTNKWILICLLVVFIGACSNEGGEQATDPELVNEIESLESTTDELETIMEEIDSSAAKVDSLLNQL